MRLYALVVRMCEAFCHDVKPSFELIVVDRPAFDSRWPDWIRHILQGKAEYVFEREQLIAALRQHRAERRVGQVREFDLRGVVDGGERLFDGVELISIRNATEAEACHLVEW